MGISVTHRSYSCRNKPRSSLCVHWSERSVSIFCYKPDFTDLKSCMMSSRSSIMVLCSVRLITIYSLPKSLHKDLYPHSTHCMQIILKSRFQFPHWVMKNVLFPKVITIFKLIYLLWFKIEQTLPGFGVTRFTSASASACFLSPFPGSCATWLRRCLNSKTLSTAHNGKTNRGRPG